MLFDQELGLKHALEPLGVLSRGFLPRETPPCFNSSGFAKFLLSQPHSAATTECDAGREGLVYDAPKRRAGRRPLFIPHPLAYADLSKFLHSNFKIVHSILRRSALSRSTPSFDPSEIRALAPEYGIDDNKLLSEVYARNCEFVVRLDVQEFSQSAEPHMIASLVRATLPEHAGFADALCSKIERANRGALGLGVGPDCHFVVAEMLLSLIDTQLAGLHSGPAFRSFDDYYFYCRSEAGAAQVARDVGDVLESNGFLLNRSKSNILRARDCFSTKWGERISAFLQCAALSEAQAGLILDLFSEMRELAREHPTHPVCEKLIAATADHLMSNGSWLAVEEEFFSIMGENTAAYPVAFEFMLRNTHPTSHSRALDFALSQLPAHVNAGRDFETCWLLWLLRRLDGFPPRATISEIALSDLPMAHTLMIALSPSADSAEEFLHALGAHGTWLCAIEATRRTGILPPTLIDERLARMASAGVSFVSGA